MCSHFNCYYYWGGSKFDSVLNRSRRKKRKMNLFVCCLIEMKAFIVSYVWSGKSSCFHQKKKKKKKFLTAPERLVAGEKKKKETMKVALCCFVLFLIFIVGSKAQQSFGVNGPCNDPTCDGHGACKIDNTCDCWWGWYPDLVKFPNTSTCLIRKRIFASWKILTFRKREKLLIRLAI